MFRGEARWGMRVLMIAGRMFTRPGWILAACVGDTLRFTRAMRSAWRVLVGALRELVRAWRGAALHRCEVGRSRGNSVMAGCNSVMGDFHFELLGSKSAAGAGYAPRHALVFA
ncbi:MAG: hypothetical protein V4550_10165 [Gemmatimonadota bacterium]